jgi:Tol biopolymer transport system component/tRNA A-37 threonylcarbamoyl transferase component Bud32
MLSSGAKLGTHEIRAMIGAGGMGEVYQAHDTKLGRDVAIKVLPEQFARDPERLARFQREAKMLAALNHPNIAAIYGLEQSGGTHYLVMELVEGPTLAERIRGGAIPIDEALPLARQIADAVEYAHDKNVIHRDLKPANIKVTAEGTVKVLDFGLAKAMSAEIAEADMSNSPTLSMAATRQGIILGTAAYMSPEQAKGKSVDRRADVWAFGAVLFEMLTGRQAFGGEDITEVLASVVKSEPAFDALPSNTPSTIRILLRRCLEKNVRQRLRDVGEARILLEGVLAGGMADEPAGSAVTRPLGRPALAFGLSTLLLGAAIAGITAWTLKPAPPMARPISRFEYDLPQSQLFRNTGRAVMALSPDGSRFVYNTTQGLYLRSMDQLDARLIPGTEGVLINPFFSPNGQWVGYFQDNQLKKIAISGGAAVTICPASNPYGVTWAPDSTIFFAQPEGIRRVSANGGTPALIIPSQEGEQFDGPQLLPGGEWVMFVVEKRGASWDDAQIVIQSLMTKERRDVWQGGSDARYLSTGHIVYALGDNLFAIPFDLATLSVKGSPVPVAEGLFRAAVTASVNYGVSDGAGSLVYVSGAQAGRLISWMDREGKFTPLRKTSGTYNNLAFSPDGKRLAMEIRDGTKTDIWTYELERDTLTRLTFGGTNDYPFWTPDGQRIVYSSQDKGGPPNLWWIRADGGGAPERLSESKSPQFFGSWRPDGKVLAFMQVNPETSYDIMTLSVEGDEKSGWKPGEPKPFLNSRFTEVTPAFSPDGRWLAYASAESGFPEVYVRPFPGPGGKWQISNGGGVRPEWSRNGRELFYSTVGDTQVMVASYSASGDSFRADKPQLWSPGQFAATGNSANFVLDPDGKRFAGFVDATSSGTTHIDIVLNWLEELKRRVPTAQR